jgi:hypothetical protein
MVTDVDARGRPHGFRGDEFRWGEECVASAAQSLGSPHRQETVFTQFVFLQVSHVSTHYVSESKDLNKIRPCPLSCSLGASFM